MRKGTRTLLATGLIGGLLALGGCASDTSEPEDSSGMGGMNHSMDGGPAPEGIVDASDPEFPVGTEVTLMADHMPGMEGAPATIVGAYDTYAYAVDYTPTTGGDPVTDHRWVVQEDLENAPDERLADGTEVTLAANHMEGMEGAEATIVSSTDETVYMVDYEADGMTMTNHKWMVESEIEPAS